MKSNLAHLLSPLISSGVLSFAEVVELLEGGQHFPLSLLILQTLYKNEGKTTLVTIYNESKVRLMEF